jgi:hypothetical protein
VLTQENEMTVPMMLPWLARKWGVDDARALELWQQACRDGETVLGERHSSHYWGYAKNRFIDLLDAEAIAAYPVLDTPWIMIHLNILRFVAGVRLWLERREARFFV